MVEVFKTNVRTRKQSDEIIKTLSGLLPGAIINFDLTDCDHILRVEDENIHPGQVVTSLERQGFQCQVVE